MKSISQELSPAPARSGFTLVEMLVSTALVMLIMVLFAEIYSAAVGSIREQEGIAKNDQKARSVVTMLRNDLNARSYREIPVSISDPNRVSLISRGLVPIHPRCLVVDNAQSGMFYISENDPGDDTDDVLSFTLFLRTEAGQYSGRVQKGPATQPNHPDSDDGVPNDGVTASRAAIVTYFLQDGKLHRRMNLLRDPLVIPNPYSTAAAYQGSVMALPTQPSDDQLGNPTTPLGTGTLLNLGSPANWYQQNAIAIQANPPVGTRTRVLGAESLDNTQALVNGPVGLPRFREGHSVGGTMANPTANPTEEYDTAMPPNFQGRLPLSGPRTGEDIVLPNVIAFDVKVFEPQDANVNGQEDTTFEGPSRGGRFVDIGHEELLRPDETVESQQSGPFRLATITTAGNNGTWGRRNQADNPNPITTYGAGGPGGNRIFDTWHPFAPAGMNIPAYTLPTPPQTDPAPSPPYYPLKIDPNSSGTNVWKTWQANTNCNVDFNNWTNSSIYFPWAYLGDFSAGYRMKGSTRPAPPNPQTQGTTNTAREPVWARIFGNEVQDGQVIWECFDNRIGLMGLRVTIRFVDPGSGQIRQLTVDHSFLD